jgi:hypothetical protein
VIRREKEHAVFGTTIPDLFIFLYLWKEEKRRSSDEKTKRTRLRSETVIFFAFA